MAVDKKINYTMQGHKKPARNYLGKQKTVKNIPVKWKSGPNTPETELAYITKAEKNLLLKKDLHGSLKHGPNTGPDEIMSLDSQGDYTADRSPAGRQSSPGGPDRSRISQDKHEAHMRSILTGQKNIGQTSAVSGRTRRGAVPEWVNTPDGPKYVGSSVKGKQGWFNKLLGRGNVQGLKSIQLRGTPGQPGFGYFSEDEEVGNIKPGYGGRILGGLAGLLTGIPFVGPAIGGAIDKYKPKPRDMSQFNELSLTPYNERKISIQNDMPMESLTMANWGNTPNITGTDQTGTDQDYQTALGEGWATNYAEGGRIGLSNGMTPFMAWVKDQYGVNVKDIKDWNFYSGLANEWKRLGGKDGGRIGYAYGDPVLPEDENENVFQIMQDQGIPFSEQVEGEEGILEQLIAKYIEAGFPPDQAEEMAMQEFQAMSQGSEQGIASLV